MYKREQAGCFGSGNPILIKMVLISGLTAALEAANWPPFGISEANLRGIMVAGKKQLDNWQEEFKRKLVTKEEAARKVKSGDRLS